jgi:hypothetical protein
MVAAASGGPLRKRNMHQFKIIALFASLLASSSYAIEKNESNIQIRGKSPAEELATPNAKICQGSVPSNVDLHSIGLSAEDLKKGVSCVAKDFDGNGYLDFVLYGAWVKSENRRYSLIVFYDGPSALKTQIIPEAVEIFDDNDPDRVLYPKNKGQAGVIKRSHDNTMAIYGVVYFFNKKKGLLKKGAYIYPNGKTDAYD